MERGEERGEKSKSWECKKTVNAVWASPLDTSLRILTVWDRPLELYFIFSLYRKWDSKALTHFSSYEIKLSPQRLYCTISGEGSFTTRNRNTKSWVWKKISCFSVVPQRKQQQLLDRLGRDLLKHSPAASSASQSEERSYWTVPHLYLPIKYVQCTDCDDLATLIKHTEFSPSNLTLARPFKAGPWGSKVFDYTYPAFNTVIWMYPRVLEVVWYTGSS